MTPQGLNIITSHEGFSSKAYWDANGKKWTIGYGTTFYPNGTPVRQGDRVTVEQGKQILYHMLAKVFIPKVMSLVKSRITQNQLDALTSFAYNCGLGNLRKSTLLAKVNSNPNDASIRNEFMKWTKSGGRTLGGLVKRRNAEADLYFSDIHNDNRQPENQRNGIRNSLKQHYGFNDQEINRIMDRNPQQSFNSQRPNMPTNNNNTPKNSAWDSLKKIYGLSDQEVQQVMYGNMPRRVQEDRLRDIIRESVRKVIENQ